MYVNAGKVYVIQSLTGLVKVGCSKDVERRKRAIENSSGTKILKVWDTEECSNYFQVERESHKVIHEFRIIGEWFNCSFDVAVFAVAESFEKFAEFNFVTDEDEEKQVNESLEKLERLLYPEHFEEEDPYDMIDLDSWIPVETDEKDILDFVMGGYLCALECKDEEKSQEYMGLYNKIKIEGIVSCKGDIQEIFCDYFWSVNGEIERYYSDYPDIIRLMYLTILKKPVDLLHEKAEQE